MELSSSLGFNYNRLQELLAAKKWREADQETRLLMLKVGGREEEGWLNTEHIQNFSCEDLNIIDQLWRQNSNNTFGFTIQKRIWEDVGGMIGKLDTSAIYLKFCDRVGWRFAGDWVHYDELIFSPQAPKGQFPFQNYMTVYGGMSVLCSRLYSCKI